MPTKKKWPTMPTITLRPFGESVIGIDASVDVGTGRAIVEVHYPDNPFSNDITYRPADAERIARALLKAAKVCRAKEAVVAAEKKRSVRK